MRPRAIEHVVVVVPARDEEALVGRCLAALQAARQAARAVLPDLTVDLVLVLDRCTDGTRSVALGHLDVRLVDLDEGRVGAARAAGVRDALDRATTAPDRTWLASTDADSAVPERLDPGARAAGRRGCRRASSAPCGPTRTTSPRPSWPAWRATRVPGRPNGHVHGANLGVRADAYLRAGGFPDRPAHEDVDLVAALAASGRASSRPTPATCVTSGRLVGRAPAGYADYLRSRFGADDEAESA